MPSGVNDGASTGGRVLPHTKAPALVSGSPCNPESAVTESGLGGGKAFS